MMWDAFGYFLTGVLLAAGLGGLTFELWRGIINREWWD